MNRETPHSAPSLPVEPVPVVCAAAYHTSLPGLHAFTFRVPTTDTRFTLHTSEPARFEIGAQYTLTVTPADEAPLPLTNEDLDLLDHCLANTIQRWQEAITETAAGAATAGHESGPRVHTERLTVEPTPAGYRTMNRLFRDERARVERLRTRLKQLRSRNSDLDDAGADQPIKTGATDDRF